MHDRGVSGTRKRVRCSAVQCRCSAVQLCSAAVQSIVFRFGAIDCATVEREGIHTVATGDGVAKYPWLTLVSQPR